MATGIVSIASHLCGMNGPARALLRLNQVFYPLLWLLTLLRLARFPRRAIADLEDHRRGPGSFAVVAGTSVFASQLMILTGDLAAARRLWMLGGLLWLIVIYGFLGRATVRGAKPELAGALDGSWLLAVVGTQSLPILGALIAPDTRGWQPQILFVSLVMYLVGWILFVVIITLIFYRLIFFAVTAETLTPTYWVTMGAAAITTLAGVSLSSVMPEGALLRDLHPFLTGLTLTSWATSTWWIPLLVALTVWRQLHHPAPMRYEPEHWAVVFPLGMYGTCTFELSRFAGLAFLEPLARGVTYVALAAWIVVLVALVWRLVTGLMAALRAVDPAGRIPE